MTDTNTENNSHCQTNRTFSWQRAEFPAIISCCAWVCFAFVYWLVTAWSIKPLYFLGLVFLLPALVLTLITYLAGSGRLNKNNAVWITALLIPVFVICSLFFLFNIALSQTSVTVTNVSGYERTLKMGGYSEKEQLAVFPEKIPKGAKDTAFYFSQSSWQEYSQTVFLQFSADKKMIDEYTEQFKKSAIQEGNADIKGVFDRVGESYIKDLTDDYSVYVFINEGNHDRKVSAVAISQKKNNIIFYAYEMRW